MLQTTGMLCVIVRAYNWVEMWQEQGVSHGEGTARTGAGVQRSYHIVLSNKITVSKF